jgi:TonB family protein
MQHPLCKSISLCVAAFFSSGGRAGAQTQAPVPAPDKPAYRIGGGISAPVPIHKPEPGYTEEARKAQLQGTVILFIVVDENSDPRNLKVIRSLGMGLDRKAMEAVNQWKFRPGMKDGNPVPVQATIEVNFRLLKDLPWPGSKPAGWSIAAEDFDLAELTEPPVLVYAPSDSFADFQRPILITANLNIDGEGHAHDVALTTNPAANTGAVAAELGRWIFTPAKQRGVPIAVHAKLTLRYLGPPTPVPGR